MRKFSRSATVLPCVQLQKLLDLFQREPCRLRLLDEPKPPEVFPSVAPDAALTRWLFEKPFSLIESDRLNTHCASGSELADRKRLNPLTLYHSTELI